MCKWVGMDRVRERAKSRMTLGLWSLSGRDVLCNLIKKTGKTAIWNRNK